MRKFLVFLLVFMLMFSSITVLADVTERDLRTLEGTYEFTVHITNPDNANAQLKQSYNFSENLPADVLDNTFLVDVKMVDGEYLVYNKGELLEKNYISSNKQSLYLSFKYRVTSSSVQNIGYDVEAEVQFDESMQSFDTLVPKRVSLIVYTVKNGEASYGYVGNGDLSMRKTGSAPEVEETDEQTGSEEAKSQLPRALTFVRGKVTIKRAGSDEWIRARQGMRLEAGDMIKTAESSYADIGMETTEFGISGSEIRMAPVSAITIPDDTLVVEKKSSIRVTIDEGIKNVYQLFQKDEFNIETPTTSMSIRGTDFVIEVDEAGNTKVLMNDGIVDVKSLYDGSTKTILSGEKITANVDEEISAIEQMNDSDREVLKTFEFENLPVEEDTTGDLIQEDNPVKENPSALVVIGIVAVVVILAGFMMKKRKRK
ncbi:MAG: FecR domain-containing protein [Clostridia bacterium]|nr:FecR domain-containing protein [Clostridia bacterium]